MKHDTKIPDDLAARLEIFQRLLPTVSTKGIDEWWFFKDISWFSVLLGMNFSFNPAPLENRLLEITKSIGSKRLQAIQQHTKNLPGHFEYLRDRLYEPRERLMNLFKTVDSTVVTG